MVLTTDEGVAMVVMDRKKYKEKVEGLLAQLVLQDYCSRTHQQAQGQSNTNIEEDQKGYQHGRRYVKGYVPYWLHSTQALWITKNP